MRDKRFVAVHRGGLLNKEHHFQLMRWACDCVEHVLPLLATAIDIRLYEAVRTAKEWSGGKASVGDAREAALGAIAVARASTDMVEIAVARAAGHTVATAHMADHSLRAAAYALKAAKAAGISEIAERRWQDEHLPPGISELVSSARNMLR